MPCLIEDGRTCRSDLYMWKYTTVADKLLIVSLAVLAAVLFYIMPGLVLSGGTRVEVCSGEKVVGRYDLREDRVVPVSGPLGKTILEIKNGRARITASPCPHKICIGMGGVGKEGGLLVCVPNEVVVRVGSGNAEGLDAVSE